MNWRGSACNAARGAAGRVVLAVALSVAMASAIASSFRAASAQTISTPARALVRVLHASPDAPNLDIYLDDVLLAPNGTFGSLTDITPIASGNHTVAIVPTGGDPKRQTLASSDISLDPNAFSLIAITGYLNDLRVNTFQEDDSALESQGSARVRSINLSPDTFDLRLGKTDGSDLLGSVAEYTAGSYLTVPAGSYDLIATPKTSQGATTPLPHLTLLPDVSYDLVLVGETRLNSINVIPVITATQQPCGQIRQTGGPTSTCVRVMNGSYGLQPVDVYIADADTPAAKGIAYGQTSVSLTAPADAFDVRIVPAGGSRDDAIGKISITQEAGQGMLVIATGKPDKLVLKSFPDSLEPVGGNLSRSSVINTASGISDVNINVNGFLEVKAIIPGEASDSRIVPAGSYEYDVIDADSSQPLAQSGQLTVEPGNFYEWVIIGDGKAGQISVIQIHVPIPTDANVASPLAT